MKQIIQRTNTLKLSAIAFVALCLLAGWILRSQIPATTIDSLSYYVELFIIALVLLIPTAIWYMARKIQYHEINRANYSTWAFVRLLPVASSMGCGLLWYLVTDSRSMLFCALIGIVALLFVWPTLGRIQNELEQSENVEQSEGEA